MKKTILFLLILLTLFMFAAGFQQLAAADVPSQEQENMEVVKKGFEVFTTTEMQKGKQSITMVDMKTMSRAIESYITDHLKAPEAKTFAELQPLLSPFYIKTLPLNDAWGNGFHYRHGTGNKKDEYAVGSGGKDGVFNGWGQRGFYWVTVASGFNNDIILANGRFAYGPVTKSKTSKPPAPETALQAPEIFKHWWKQFSGVKAEINDIFASGDKVVMRWTFHGIKDRLLEENWQFNFISLFRLDNGKVVEMWHGDDMLKALKKHGFTMKPPAPKTFAARLKVTMEDMYIIGKALKYYIEDYHQAPKADSIKKLSKILQPFYIKTLPLADAWENEIMYKVDPGNPKNYWIGSPGSDGKFNGFDQKGTWQFKEGEKGQDIVLANGHFTYKPKLEKKK